MFSPSAFLLQKLVWLHLGPTQKIEDNLSVSRSYFFFFFLGPYLWHMEVPRLGVKLELQLLAYIIATATQDLSYVCDLHHRSWQHQILNPMNEARDQTCILMDPIRVC